MPGVSTPRPVSSSEARYRTCSLSESARDCANDGISKVQAEKATRVAETRATTAAREGNMSRGINFRIPVLGPDHVDYQSQVNRRTAILEDWCFGTCQHWRKFAMSSRHGKIMVNFNSEVKSSMATIVI